MERASRAVETVYDLASLTKVVATTAAAMLLVQRGKLDLEMPLGELLPGFVVGRSNRRSWRARDLAAFARTQFRASRVCGVVSGLPRRRPRFSGNACALTIEAEPGTRAEYSDPGFILLGKALEALIGEQSRFLGAARDF